MKKHVLNYPKWLGQNLNPTDEKAMGVTNKMRMLQFE
jgi:hypothetical protein